MSSLEHRRLQLEFLEVSYLSFIAGLGAKLKGTREEVRQEDIRAPTCASTSKLVSAVRERWFVLKDTYVAYIRPEDGAVCHVQLMDNGFQVHSGQAETNVKHGIKICSLSRELLVQCWTKRKMKEWCADIKRAMETSGKDFIQTNRFGSFAPVRPESWCRWFVDGAGYFDAVASAIAEAKEEIFITDWWLSPEIYLKRPATQCGSWRLDLLLKRKADEGVKVFVLLYKEVEVALGINSAYSKISLTQKNPDNIKVLRHPDHAPGTGTFLWGHHEKLVIVDQAIAFVGGLDMCYARWDDNKHRLTDLGEGPLLPAGIQSGLQESGMADLLVRLTGVHMKPGNDPATNTEKAKFDDYFPLLLPKSYDNITILPEWKCNAINCQVQVLRSVSNWSIGIKKTEDSIHQAYLTAIRESKYFIYIENQFFITQMDSTVVINGIAQALFDRIRQAHEAGENFRVYVVMPLLPGFEGEVGAPSGYAIQAVTHWQYTSISRGGNSLLERLSAAGIPSQEYISFHGTRTHGELRGQPVSELIYIHSKMLIVDDRLCIIGSANINERSMRGSRDSETAAIFEDTEFVPCTFDGKEGQRGLFVGSLRTQVFRELLGLMDVSGGADVVADPVSDHFYTHVWMTTSAINTRVFDQVFNCIPTDLVRTFEQLADYKERAKRHLAITDVDAAREQLLRVKGYLVFLPLHFLADVDIRPPATTKEGLVPDMLWT
ncbi:PREDICTED: LOW QUALITY PROTEIN: phospholipase D2-like [Priapulus caudatus]|uniref:phospholipase D n=1 Tax=Priapulus caudatus TaxID=37621 RepID=A0ABM1DW55_PRICU|nr:PREDICTED: LOW QUALITY PROTEIN: phospholipase D2-like [Priapulus caudatus]